MGVRGRHISAGEHHVKMGVQCKQLPTYRYYKIDEKCKAFSNFGKIRLYGMKEGSWYMAELPLK